MSVNVLFMSVKTGLTYGLICLKEYFQVMKMWRENYLDNQLIVRSVFGSVQDGHIPMRKKKAEKDIKIPWTLKITKWVRDEVRLIENYNPKVESKMIELIEEENKNKKDKKEE